MKNPARSVAIYCCRKLAVSAVSGLDDNAVFVAEAGVLAIQRIKALGAVYKVKMQYIDNGQFQLIEAEEIVDAE